MSNLNGIPSADHFETRLANLWNGTVGTVYVDEVPNGSIIAGEYSYIVVNPGESNMQVAKVDGWDSNNRTFNVVELDIPSGIGTSYTAKTHPLGSKVTFSNNYAFWKDIQDAVNSKADDSDISAVGKSNDYADLDNKPSFGPVATSNDYNDLYNKPAPVSIALGDKVLELSLSNELLATISASYDSGTKKITLYGANSAVISEIDCTAFIKDGMIQDVKIVTDPAGYAPGKYLEFDFNTDSGIEDVYIALSDLAVYTAGTGIDITSNAITLKKATTNSLGGVIVGSRLSVVDGTISADSQTDENYTTAEKSKLSGIESTAQVNKLEKVQVNGTDLPISSKSVNVQIKSINGNSLTGSGDLDLMARTYTAGTGIDISASDEISINSTYQTTIANKANSADLASVATSGNYSDLNGVPEDLSDFNNDTGFITANDLQAGANVQISGTTISATDTTYTASDFDIKDLSDSTGKRTSWDGKQDAISDLSTIRSGASAGATAVQPGDIGTAAACNTGTSSGNVPVLDSNGKLDTSIVPDVHTDAVSSVNSKTGAVVLDADDISDSTTTNKFVTATEKDNWNGKQDVLTAGSNISISGTTISATDTIPNNAKLTIQKNGTKIDDFTADASVDKTINITVPTQASDINALPSSTKYGASLSLSINSTTYVVTATLKDQDGNTLGTAQTIDLPLESVVVSGSYDDATKKIILTLQSGSTIEFSVADLVSGLQTEITNSNKLDADLVDDSTSTNKFVTASDLTNLGNLSGTNTGDQVASDFDIKDLTDSTNLMSAWSGKQDALSTQTAYTSKGSATKVPQITTNTLGQVTGITEVTITQPDISGCQLKSNMVTNLTSPDDDHYPTAKAVSDAISGAGQGDMLASVYDPNGVGADVFDYSNFTNTPTIPSNTSDLNNDSGFITSSYHDSSKQDALSSQTAYTSKGTATKVPTITTNSLGQVTAISETNITFPVTSVNGSTGAVTGLQTTANLKTSLSDNSDSYYPSQKAVKTAVDAKQDALTTQTAYTSKGTSTKVATITTNTLGQVTSVSETSIAFPVTSVNGNTGAVTGLQEALVNQSNIKSVNGQSILGSGDLLVGTVMTETDYGQITPVNGVMYFTTA